MRFFLKTPLWICLVALCLGLALVVAGCGSSDKTSSSEQEVGQRIALEARRAAAQRRHREVRRIRARERRALARRRAIQVAAREQSEAREEAEAEESAEAESSECDPNYSGACLDPYASDYDCEGGSGNGPDYTGPVVVVGDDHYGLDADGDGYGCE
jgi:hypothetical protein